MKHGGDREAIDWGSKLSDFESDGYVVFENAIPSNQVEALREALLRAERDHGLGYGETDFEGRHTVRIYNLLVYGEEFWGVPIDPVALAFAERILGEELQLSALQAITLCPGQVEQPMHADDQLIPVPKPHPAFTLNCMWAISDFTEENGATHLVPGSHRAGSNPEAGVEYETVQGTMLAGSLLFLHGSLWHKGGANRTDERRFAISSDYTAGFLRGQENQLLAVPSEMMRRFPRRLQELCGYSTYRGLYGHVANADPITLLGHNVGKKLIWERSQEEMYGDQTKI